MLTLYAVFLLWGGVTGQATAPPIESSHELGPSRISETRPVVELPSFPSGKVIFVGGVVERVDHVRDQLVVHVFGGKTTKVSFDTRTEFLRDDRPTSAESLRTGSPVSIDTVSGPNGLFAKTIRITSSPRSGELRGQLVSYDSARRSLLVRPDLGSSTLEVKLAPRAAVLAKGHPSDPTALRKGALIRASLSGKQEGIVDSVEILAEPGERFVFLGTLASLDLRAKQIGLMNKNDGSLRTFSIADLLRQTIAPLQEGQEIQVEAEFDGKEYRARSIASAATP